MALDALAIVVHADRDLGVRIDGVLPFGSDSPEARASGPPFSVPSIPTEGHNVPGC